MVERERETNTLSVVERDCGRQPKEKERKIDREIKRNRERKRENEK